MASNDDELEAIDPKDANPNELVRDDESISGLRPINDTENPPTNDEKLPVIDENQTEPIEDDTDLENEEPDVSINEPIAEPTPLNKYQNFLQQYQALQDQRRKGDLAAGLLAAGDKIGQSMAGRYSGQFNPDLTGVKLLQQQANRPVTDFEQGQMVQGRGLQLQQEMNMNDPTSTISEAYRNYFKQRILRSTQIQDPQTGKMISVPDTSMFPNIDNYSANDLQALLKGIGRPIMPRYSAPQPYVNQQTGEKTVGTLNSTTGQITDLAGNNLGSNWIRDYRAQNFIDPSTQERVGFSTGTGKVTGNLSGPGVSRPGAPVAAPGQQTNELTRSMLTTQQQKQLDNSRHQFIEEVKDDRTNLNSTDRTIAALQAGAELGDLPREEQDQLNRSFGQKGHLSDQQVGVALGRPDWADRFQNVLSIGMNGKLTDDNRQFLLDTLKVIRNQNLAYINSKSQVYSNNLYNDFKSAPNLQRANISPKSVSNLLGVQAAQASAGQQKTVVAKGYNKKTNQTQFVYSDGTKEIVDGQQ